MDLIPHINSQRLNNMGSLRSTSPLDLPAIASAIYGSHMAAFGGGKLAIYTREDCSKGWTLHAALPALDDPQITQLCWGLEDGELVLAGGTLDGNVVLWQATPWQQGTWQQTASFKEATLAVLGMAFAPPGLGQLLAVAYADGQVRLFKASQENWQLQNLFQTGSGAATALSWCQPSQTLPSLLLVGTATAGAQVWVYQQQLMHWEQAATLGHPEDYRGEPVADVAWALGRPRLVAAVAAGTAVLLWELSGAADSLQAHQLACLQHATPVWQVEWGLLGSWLAASTEGRDVCMWRPDLAGEWLMLNCIVEEDSAGHRSSTC